MACGLDDDFLAFSFLGFEYITGGRFTMLIAVIITIFSYVKYHKPEYSIIIGLTMLPISYTAFSDEFLSLAFVMVALVLATYGFHMLIRQTRG